MGAMIRHTRRWLDPCHLKLAAVHFALGLTIFYGDRLQGLKLQDHACKSGGTEAAAAKGLACSAHHLLQSPGFLFELLQPLYIADVHAAYLALHL
jgi:hypothetical protein